MKNIVLTGGCGFIGSHTCVLLLQNDFNVHIIDNLYNSHKNVIDSIRQIVPEKSSNLYFHYISLLDYSDVLKTFKKIGNIDGVIHFAGLKSVQESISLPILYYDVNINSTLNLLKVMREVHCKTLIFSSSATVYGKMKSPLYEKTLTGCGISNPYGKTKYFIEQILKDVYKSEKGWNIILLRYFNPVGAHSSGLLGENPSGIPNNLMPYVMKVAIGEYPAVNIYGKDYDTNDGTAIRDYIHVMDLANGHLKAFEFLQQKSQCLEIFNLGSGIGTSVLEMIEIMKNVSGKDIPYKFTKRRKGDVPIVYCNPSKANRMLKWKTTYNIVDMCSHLWKYYKNLKSY